MDLMNTREAAAWTGTSEEIIRRMIREGRLPARPRGKGPKSGYLIEDADLMRLVRSRKRPLGLQKEAAFTESASLFPGLPTPTLPPIKGSTRDLIDYASQCHRLAEAALAVASRRLEGGPVE
jgi:excisionase family DNA binding protein